MTIGQSGQEWVLSSGGVLKPAVVGNVYSTSTITSVQGTTPQVLFTAPVGYVITECGMQVDPTCTIASAGMVNLLFSDSSFGTFFNIRWYIPQSFAPGNAPTNTRVTNGPGFYWNNKVANTSVSVSTDVALTAGQIRFFARYALVNFIG